MKPRTVRNILLLCLTAGPLLGCERVDWNWDASWWRTPRPVVPPAPSREGGQRPRRVDSTARTSEPRRVHDDHRAVNAGPDDTDSHAAPAAQKNRPYYQLYLLSNDPTSEVPRGAGH